MATKSPLLNEHVQVIVQLLPADVKQALDFSSVGGTNRPHMAAL